MLMNKRKNYQQKFRKLQKSLKHIEFGFHKMSDKLFYTLKMKD